MEFIEEFIDFCCIRKELNQTWRRCEESERFNTLNSYKWE